MIEKAKDSILVCISDAKSNSLVIKKANEIASKENARLIALYVCDRNDYQKKQEKGFLQQNLDLAESIGAMIEIIYDDDIAAQIVNFAKLYRVKKIVLGRNNNQRNFFILNKSICDEVIEKIEDIDIHIVPFYEDFSIKRFETNKNIIRDVFISLSILITS